MIFRLSLKPLLFFWNLNFKIHEKVVQMTPARSLSQQDTKADDFPG